MSTMRSCVYILLLLGIVRVGSISIGEPPSTPNPLCPQESSCTKTCRYGFLKDKHECNLCECDEGSGTYDCNRAGQGCKNDKPCNYTGQCDCGTTHFNYDCSIPAALKDADDRCNDNPYPCGLREKSFCVKDTSGYACKCIAGFDEKSRADSKCTGHRYRVQCYTDRMLVNINPYGSFQGRIYVWGNPECSITKPVKYEHRTFVGGLARNINYTGDTTCGDVPRTDQNNITVYSTKVFVGYSKMYTSWRDEIVTVTCKLDHADNVIVSSVSSNNIDTSQLREVNAENNINAVTLEVASNNKRLYAGRKVNLGDVLTFALTGKAGIDYIQLYGVKIDNAKPRTDQSYQVVNLLEEGCKGSSDISDIWSDLPVNDGARNKVKFEFRTFVFTESSTLRVMLTIHACHSDTDALCTPVDCSGSSTPDRKKRVANDVMNQTHVVERTFFVTSPERGDSDSAGLSNSDDRSLQPECNTSPSDSMVATIAALAAVVALLFILLFIFAVLSFLRKGKNQ